MQARPKHVKTTFCFHLRASLILLHFFLQYSCRQTHEQKQPLHFLAFIPPWSVTSVPNKNKNKQKSFTSGWKYRLNFTFVCARVFPHSCRCFSRSRWAVRHVWESMEWFMPARIDQAPIIDQGETETQMRCVRNINGAKVDPQREGGFILEVFLGGLKANVFWPEVLFGAFYFYKSNIYFFQMFDILYTFVGKYSSCSNKKRHENTKMGLTFCFFGPKTLNIYINEGFFLLFDIKILFILCS